MCMTHNLLYSYNLLTYTLYDLVKLIDGFGFVHVPSSVHRHLSAIPHFRYFSL